MQTIILCMIVETVQYQNDRNHNMQMSFLRYLMAQSTLRPMVIQNDAM